MTNIFIIAILIFFGFIGGGFYFMWHCIEKGATMPQYTNPIEYKKEAFGYVVDCEDVQKNQEEYAKVFAEGSEALEDLLLYLWSKGINTRGCCVGHPANEKHAEGEAYIYFETKKEQNPRKVLKLLQKELNAANLDFSIAGYSRSARKNKFKKGTILFNTRKHISSEQVEKFFSAVSDAMHTVV